MLLQALYQVTILLVLNFDGRSILRLKHDSREHADKVKNTFIFNTFVLCQVSCITFTQTVQYNINCSFNFVSWNFFCYIMSWKHCRSLQYIWSSSHIRVHLSKLEVCWSYYSFYEIIIPSFLLNKRLTSSMSASLDV